MFVDFNIINQLGSPSLHSNTLANRPPAGQVGRLFISTNTFEIYRDTGTGWDLIGGPGSSTVVGTGAAGQVTYWTGANSVAGNNNLFWDIANERLGIGTTTPSSKVDIAGNNVLLHLKGGSNAYMMFHENGVDEYKVGVTGGNPNFQRWSIYDQSGAKETITIDKQSRFVGINYQYTSLADQPAYNLDVAGSIRSVNDAYIATGGIGGITIGNTTAYAWGSTHSFINLGTSGTYTSQVGNVQSGINFYIDNLGTPRYKNNAAIAYLASTTSIHSWGFAPSGIAGNAATINTGLLFNSSNRLLVNTVVDLGDTLLVNGVTRMTSTLNVLSGAYIQNQLQVDNVTTLNNRVTANRISTTGSAFNIVSGTFTTIFTANTTPFTASGLYLFYFELFTGGSVVNNYTASAIVIVDFAGQTRIMQQTNGANVFVQATGNLVQVGQNVGGTQTIYVGYQRLNWY